MKYYTIEIVMHEIEVNDVQPPAMGRASATYKPAITKERKVSEVSRVVTRRETQKDSMQAAISLLNVLLENYR